MTKPKGPKTNKAIIEAENLVTEEDLEQYRDALEALNLSYDNDIKAVMKYIDFDDIARARDMTISLLVGNIRPGAKAAARLASEWYDLVKRRSFGYVDKPSLVMSTYNEAAIEGFVRAEIESVVQTGKTEAFTREVLKRFNTDMKRSASYCTIENGKRESRKLVKYARVLGGGSNTCRFCIMLASRGFDYYTLEAASHFHDGCRCVVTPGFFTQDGRTCYTEVEGYHPDKILDQYYDMVDNKEWKIDI